MEYIAEEPIDDDVDVDEVPELEEWERVVGDQSKASELAQILLVLEKQVGSDNYPASYRLVNLIEEITRGNVADFFNQNEFQRKAAEGLLNLTLRSSVGERLPSSMKVELRAMVKSRFSTAQEHLMAASILELKRRKELAASGWTNVSPEMITWSSSPRETSDGQIDSALQNFEENLVESLSLHPSQRNTFLRFWNATELAFNQFQMECSRPAACQTKFETFLGQLRDRGQIDRETEGKLVAIYEARAATESQLLFLNKEREIEQTRTNQILLAEGEDSVAKITGREVTYLASTTMAFDALDGTHLPRLILGLVVIWILSALATVPWKRNDAWE